MKEIFSGNNIKIEDGTNKKAVINIKGVAEQEVREGYNLVDFSTPNSIAGNTTYNFENDICSVVATASSYRRVEWNLLDLLKNNAGKTLKFCYENIDFSNALSGAVQLKVVIDGTNVYTLMATQNASDKTYTIPEDVSNITEAVLGIYSNNTATDSASSITITKPMLILGTEAKPYEQYGATPSPEFESPVKTVGQNVQLFDKDNANILNGVIDTGTNIIRAHDACRCLYIKCSKNRTYTTSKIVTQRFVVGTTAEVPKNGVSMLNFIINNQAKTITITTTATSEYLVIYFFMDEDTLTEQEILDSIKIVEGTEVGSYSPHGQGSVEIGVVNESLIDFNKLGTYHAEYEFKDNVLNVNGTAEWARTRIDITALIKKHPNKTLKFYCESYEGNANSRPARLAISYADGTVNNINLLNYDGKYNLYTIPSDISNISSVMFTNYSNYSVSTNASTLRIVKPMLCFEENSTKYVQHQSQKVSLPTQKEFVKIGDVEDTFVNIDGKWYEKHYSLKTVFDGTGTSWGYAEQGFWIDIDNLLPKCNVMSNYYTNYNTATELMKHAYGIGVLYARNRLYIRNTDYSNINDFKAHLQELYNNGTPVIVYYVLSEPELIECTPTQSYILDQLENIELYDGINYITATSSVAPNLDVTAYKTVEDYDVYVSTDGYLMIPSLDIKYLIDFNESNIPTMPEAVESAIRAAGRNGDIVLATTYEPIPINIVCYTEDNLTQAEKSAKERKVNNFLNSIKNKTIALAIEKDNKFYNVKYSGALTTINYPKHLKFSIPLKSSESYGKGLIRKSIAGNATAESETVENVGAIFTINGPAQNPIISLNDYSMEYNMSILDGARVEIDSSKSTITNINSDGVRTNVMKYYNHQFPKIESGINELKVLSGVDDEMNVKVVWNDLKL